MSEAHKAIATPASSLRRALSAIRRGQWSRVSAVILLFLIGVAIFADFFASNAPVLAHVRGKTFVLANVTHPPELATVTDTEWKQGWRIDPIVARGPNDVSDAQFAPPFSRGHVLGTDGEGRDVFARLVFGTRTTLTFALVAASTFVVLGAVLGALAGFFGGAVDTIVSRLIEAVTSLPTVVVVLAIQALSEKPSTLGLFLAVSSTRWAEVARVVRTEVTYVLAQDYVGASRALGAGPWRLLVHHVFPNARAQAMVSAAFGISACVLIEAQLDFLGFGLSSRAASWGGLMGELRHHGTAWWLFAFPALLLFLVVSSQNVVAETLRDALDPHLRRAKATPELENRESQLPSSRIIERHTQV